MHNLRQSFAGCYGQHAYAMLNRLNILRSKQAVFMLVAHIFYFNIVQRAPLLGRIQSVSGMLGVDMHLNDILHHGHNHRIAEALQSIADRFFIYAGALDDKFRTVRIFQIQRLSFNSYACRCLRRNLQHLAVMAAQSCQAALKENYQSLAAGVHYARSF